MRFQWKLTILLVLLATVVGVAIAGLNYSLARKLLFQQIQSKVLSIAATTAARIDGGLHESVAAEDQPQYLQIQRQLRAIRDANRRADVNVRFIYTMRAPDAAGAPWTYVVDAEEPGDNHSAIGDPVKLSADAAREMALGNVFAENTFAKDEFGEWLSANAPIRDANGQIVAMLGVDVSAGDVVKRLNRLVRASLLALACGILAALALAIVLSRLATRSLSAIRVGLGHIAEGEFEYRVEVKSKDEFGEVADAVNRMAGELREREILKGALTRYVSRDVVNQVLADREMPALRGQRREITVLMADIRDFTALSHRVPPEELVNFLNRYLERMIEIILRNGGTLDKFLGDGVLAIFGAPLDDAEHRFHAMEASREMLDAVDDLQESFSSTPDVNLRIGIAVHSGYAVVGNIGSEQRMEYTAIGEVVNVASRIESLNKEFATELLVSEAVADGLKDRIEFREVGTVQPRGVDKPMKILTVDRLKEALDEA